MQLETILGPVLISIVCAVIWNHAISRLHFSGTHVDMSGLCFKMLPCLCFGSCWSWVMSGSRSYCSWEICVDIPFPSGKQRLRTCLSLLLQHNIVWICVGTIRTLLTCQQSFSGKDLIRILGAVLYKRFLRGGMAAHTLDPSTKGDKGEPAGSLNSRAAWATEQVSA